MELPTKVEPKHRKRAGLAATKHGIFMYGGKSDSGRGLDDFLCYRRSWEYVVIEGEVRPPPGWGYNLVADRLGNEDYLLFLVGGITTFEFYRFKLLSLHPVVGVWELVVSSVSFAGLIGHSTFLLGDGWGIIVGGQTIDKRMNTDVLLFENWGTNVSKLMCSGLSPLSRRCAGFARITNYIFCFGGLPEGNCFVLNLADRHWYAVPGDWPNFYSAGSVTIHDVIYIHGGINHNFRFQSMLFKLSLSRDDCQPIPSFEELKEFCKHEKILMPIREWDWGNRNSVGFGNRKPTPLTSEAVNHRPTTRKLVMPVVGYRLSTRIKTSDQSH
jgi:hypothetical protein